MENVTPFRLQSFLYENDIFETVTFDKIDRRSRLANNSHSVETIPIGKCKLLRNVRLESIYRTIWNLRKRILDVSFTSNGITWTYPAVGESFDASSAQNRNMHSSARKRPPILKVTYDRNAEFITPLANVNTCLCVSRISLRERNKVVS